jgi:hypothetical protein
MRTWLPVLVAVGIAGCAQTLPEHDNRIFTAVPVAKLSAADLVQAFTSDPAAAGNRFVGRAVEISGVIEGLPEAPVAGTAFLLTAGDAPPHVRALFHEDRAVEAFAGLANGQRVTIRCFCEGMNEHVQLKSCVVP